MYLYRMKITKWDGKIFLQEGSLQSSGIEYAFLSYYLEKMRYDKNAY